MKKTYKAKINVEKWIEYEESTRLEEQVKFFIASEIEAGLNCYYDNTTEEPMTKEDWKNYVWNSIELLKGMEINGNEYTHLRFFSKEKMFKLIDEYLENYQDIQKYIKK